MRTCLHVLVLTSVINIRHTIAQDTSEYIETYILDTHFNDYYWLVTKTTFPYTRCLLISANTSDATVMCDQQYDQITMNDNLQLLLKYKPMLFNLNLVCALDDPDVTQMYKTCVCADVSLYSENFINYEDVLADVVDQDQLVKQFSELRMTLSLCRYRSTLTKTILSGYTSLHVFTISDLPIEAIEPGAFDDVQSSLQVLDIRNIPLKEENIPDGLLCDMRDLLVIVLRNLSSPMSEFPKRMFTCDNGNQSTGGLSKLEAVFADGNNFGRLPGVLIGNAAKYVLVLNLTSNGVSNISVDAFQGMTSLDELNLDHNDIDHIPRGLFTSLTSLRYLSLRYNQIEHLDLSLFQSLVMLGELNMNGNRLHTIDGSFSTLPMLRSLSLDDNHLTEINATMFTGAYFILEIFLGNNLLSHLHPDVFSSSLFFLRKLELRYNQLNNATNLKEAFYGHLEFLGYLGLSHNELTELLPRQFQKYTYVHSLETIDLSYNKIQVIDEDCLLDMVKLNLLSLSHNEITEIKVDTFRHLPLLTLWIDDNRLGNIPDDAIPPQVAWLSLVDNRIQTFPRVSTPLLNLMHMYIGQNNITYMDNSTLTHYTSLTLLNLTNMGLTDLGEKTFDNIQELEYIELSKNQLDLDFSVDYFGDASLIYLNLSNNAIKSANNLFEHGIKYARILDLSSNPLKVFPDQPKLRPLGTSFWPNTGVVNYLYIKNCSLVYVDPRAFEMQPNLIHLDISDNHLTYLDQLHIHPPDNAHYFVFLFNNPIRCDCQMTWLKQAPYSDYYKPSHCSLQITNELVPFESVTNEQFMCQEVTNCLVDHNSCACFTNNATRRSVIYVQCTGGNMPRIPSNIPVTAQVLDLHGNDFVMLSLESMPDKMATTELYLNNCSISNISPNQFDKLYLLEILDLSNNEISEIKSDLLTGLHKLTILYLYNNRIATIHPDVFDVTKGLQVLLMHMNALVTNDNTTTAISQLPYLQSLSLHGNQWECGCDNATFKHWLQERTDILLNLTDIQCNESAILTLPDDLFICYDTRVYVERHYKAAVIGSSISAICLVILLACVITSYKHRELLYVLIYYKFGWRRRMDEDDDCPYDAFIVYTNTEAAIPSWVRVELLPALEPPYRVFIEDRDSIPGRVRSDEIITTIHESKRSVFILSQDALSDHYFLFAFQTAYNYMQETDNHHRIVLVVMENINIKDLADDLDAQLQTFIKTKQYIKQTDKRFWKKLLFYMPQPPEENASEDQPPEQVNMGHDDFAQQDVENVSNYQDIKIISDCTHINLDSQVNTSHKMADDDYI